MRRSTLDVAYGGVLLFVGAFLMWETTDPKYADTMGLGVASDPAFYPQILLSFWLAFAALMVVRGLIRRGPAVDEQCWTPVVKATALVAFYSWLITAIGFLIASILLCLALMLMFGYRGKVGLALVGVGFPVLTWYVFEFLLRIPLPPSPWFDAL